MRHLRQRDVSMVVVSRAPFSKLEAYRKRMGWTFAWYSSGQSDFNHDFHVSFEDLLVTNLVNHMRDHTKQAGALMRASA